MTSRQEATVSMLESILVETIYHGGEWQPLILFGLGLRLSLVDPDHAREFANEIQILLESYGLDGGLPPEKDTIALSRAGRRFYEGAA